MRIAIERSGGIAGLTRRAAVDEAALVPAEARRFRALMAAVDFAGLARAKQAKGAPDRFVYAITADVDGKTYTATVGESAVPDALAACIAYAFDRAAG